MKSKKVVLFIGVLVLLTVLAAVVHLSIREQVPEHSVLVTTSEKEYLVDIKTLDYEPVSGVRMNGKGEEIPVEGDGIAASKLLSHLDITEFSKITIIADDSYSAEVTADEIKEKGKVFFLLEEDTLRLVVFGDKNSKRSISNVVEIQVE